MTKLIDAGVDWITGTDTDPETAWTHEWRWNWLKSKLGVTGGMVKRATFMGYVGERIQHAFFGQREDGVCVILSGALARDEAGEWLEAGMRPSRLDLQATWGPTSSPQRQLQFAFDHALAHKTETGRPPKVRMWVERAGPTGVYVGSRQSETMLRMYDKGLESGERAYAGAVRYEVEFKGERARSVAGSRLNFLTLDNWALAIVHANFKSRGILPLFESPRGEVVLHKTSAPTPVEGKMAWLEQQVSPTVQALIESVGWERVADILFPDRLTGHEDDDILV